jgi:hypothetical protein
MSKFSEISKEYWAKEEAASVASSSSASGSASGTAVVTPPSTDALIDAFSAAFDTPVIQKVTWPAAVPVNHPIRALPVHVRLWTGPEWTKFWELSKPILLPTAAVGSTEASDINQEATTDRLHQQFWYVVLISACDSVGKQIFSPMVMDDQQEAFVSGFLKACLLMKQKYSGPAGLLTMNPLYEAALGFNGLLKSPEERDGKNSDATTSSTSSGE